LNTVARASDATPAENLTDTHVTPSAVPTAGALGESALLLQHAFELLQRSFNLAAARVVFAKLERLPLHPHRNRAPRRRQHPPTNCTPAGPEVTLLPQSIPLRFQAAEISG
jgi:hypothetical protein